MSFDFRHRSACAPALLLFLVPALATLAHGQEIRVDLGREDFVDFGGAQGVLDLPGPDGHVTLREAVTAANNTPGPQTITFAIPTEEWSLLFEDRAIIRLEGMLYLSDDETTLDFSTQRDFTGDTNPSGNEVGLHYAGPPAGIPCLWLAADRCTVRGLDIAFGNNFGNGIWISGNENVVLGCTTTGLQIRGDYGGGDSNRVGGTLAGDGNTFSEGVDVLAGASDNVFVGNTFRWGLRISGDTFFGTCDRNRVGGPSAAERNRLAGHGYYAEEGLPSGSQLEVFHARDTHIEGNLVGPSADGLRPLDGRSGTAGIVVGIGAEGTRIHHNLVAGIAMVGVNHYQGQRFGVGIAIIASARDTTLTANRIGVAADGSALPNVTGIVVQRDPNGTPAAVSIGGETPTLGNLVAYNETTGVLVGFGTGGVSLRANSIHDNGALGIDLLDAGGTGVSPNDALDLDVGGNGLQNFPSLSLAVQAPARILLGGRLDSAPLEAYALDFFASESLDPSGFGEGRLYLGSTTLVSDPAGGAAFLVSLPASVPTGWFVSATATALARGETSEFSAGREVTGYVSSSQRPLP